MEKRICIVRSNMAGVFFGLIEKINPDKSVLISNARKIYYWEGAYTMEDLADKGIDVKKSKVTCEIESVLLSDYCQVIPLTDKALKILNNSPTWTVR